MSLFGECVDCGEHAPLRLKPDVAVGDQSRPSVCDRCHDRREELSARYVCCEECGDRLPESRATSLDVSGPNEYYPEFIHFCPTHGPTVEEAA